MFLAARIFVSHPMITYEANRWKACSWRRDTRYYHCELQQDLFGTWIVHRAWGDIRSHRGREMTVHCDSYQEADRAFNDVIKRRKYRRYELVDSQNIV